MELTCPFGVITACVTRRRDGGHMSDNGNRDPQPMRVLVVDDEANIVDLVRMSLRFHGFDVVTAASGRDAIAAVTETAPDLVVLDVLLPDTDGFEVCRRLRDAGIETPVIFLTAVIVRPTRSPV